MMSPAVSRWTGSWPERVTTAEAAERIERTLAAIDAGAGPILAIERREDAALLGWIGLTHDAEDRSRAILGYWLGEAFHGQGYAGEAAAAMVEAGWRRMDIALIEAGAQPANAASIAILRRLGMRPVGERMHFASARQREELCAYFELPRPA